MNVMQRTLFYGVRTYVLAVDGGFILEQVQHTKDRIQSRRSEKDLSWATAQEAINAFANGIRYIPWTVWEIQEKQQRESVPLGFNPDDYSL